MAKLYECRCKECCKLIFRCRCKTDNYEIKITETVPKEKRVLKDQNT